VQRFLLGLAIAGCASAVPGNSIIGGIIDAGPGDSDFPLPDASLIDAPPQQITMTQTMSNAITRNNSFGCFRGGVTRENSYYRVFFPADHAIATPLHITQVSFGVEFASAGLDVVQPAAVRLGVYGGTPSGTTLDTTLVTPLAEERIEIPDGEGTTVNVPITADLQPSQNLIVEIAIPDGLADANEFAIGTNSQGERRPGYTRGPVCGVISPTTMHSIAASASPPLPLADLLIAVTGNR